MSSVRENPPSSIYKPETLEMYQTLYDDITCNGGTIRYDDRHALAELAIVIVDMVRWRKNIDENGDVMEVPGDKGNIITKKNPAVEALFRVQPHYRALLAAFKLTPVARGKHVAGVENGKQEDGWEEI